MTENAPHANDELQHLRAENMRLKRLLVSHGIAWEEPRNAEIVPVVAEAEPETHFTIAEKIALFRRLFRGRVMFILFAGIR